MSFSSHQSIKHLVESLRIPHTEIGVILVNQALVDSSFRLQDGDLVEIFPPGRDAMLAQFNLMPDDNNPTKQMGSSARQSGFLLDNHLGKLAIYLRLLGFDTWYRNDYQDQELASLAEKTGRILLTRDRGLLMRKQVAKGYCIHSLSPKEQLGEVLLRYDLLDQITPFKRCLRCNYPLEPVAKSEIVDRLLPLTREYYQEFHICRRCNQIYWKGSHYDHMLQFIEQLRSQHASP